MSETRAGYREIRDWILARIHGGEWKEGNLVPSEPELTRQFGVARMTVNRALRELTDSQILVRVQGSGTYVAPPKYQSTLVQIRSIKDEILARGHLHDAELLRLETCAATGTLAAELELAEGAQAFYSRILHRDNGMPVQYEERWVVPARVPDYLEQDFSLFTPSEYLVREAPLQRVEYRIDATLPAAGIRKALQMDAKEPCLRLHRRTWSQGGVASVADLWHPGSRYQFTGHF